jgi:hypothetical protein
VNGRVVQPPLGEPKSKRFGQGRRGDASRKPGGSVRSPVGPRRGGRSIGYREDVTNARSEREAVCEFVELPLSRIQSKPMLH